MTYLCELATKWGTDKRSGDGHNYTPVYAELFKDINIVRKVLEIGVGEPQAGKPNAPSLRMWEEFFPQAQIWSADSNPRWFVKGEGRIQPTIFCDQGNKESLQNLISKVGDSFDLVVDDGSHASEDQFLTLETLLPIVRVGGFFVIEDIWEVSPWKTGWPVKDLIAQIENSLDERFSLRYVRTGDNDSSLIIVERKS